MGITIKRFEVNRLEQEVLPLIKLKHPDWLSIEPIQKAYGFEGYAIGGKTIKYAVMFKTRTQSDTWFYVEEDKKWMKIAFPSGALIDP